jgi:hypothetical protein
LIGPTAVGIGEHGNNWMVTRLARIDRKLNREPAVSSREYPFGETVKSSHFKEQLRTQILSLQEPYLEYEVQIVFYNPYDFKYIIFSDASVLQITKKSETDLYRNMLVNIV